MVLSNIRSSAEWEAMEQARRREKEEERSRIAAMTPEQRVADLQKCISESMDYVVKHTQLERYFRTRKLRNDGLRRYFDRDWYEQRSNLRKRIAEIMEKYLGTGDVILLSDQIDEEIVDKVYSEITSELIHSAEITHDQHFAENCKEYQKQRAELVAEVMRVFEVTKKK